MRAWKYWLLLETNKELAILISSPNWFMQARGGYDYSSLTGIMNFQLAMHTTGTLASIYDFHMKHNSI